MAVLLLPLAGLESGSPYNHFWSHVRCSPSMVGEILASGSTSGMVTDSNGAKTVKNVQKTVDKYSKNCGYIQG